MKSFIAIEYLSHLIHEMWSFAGNLFLHFIRYILSLPRDLVPINLYITLMRSNLQHDDSTADRTSCHLSDLHGDKSSYPELQNHAKSVSTEDKSNKLNVQMFR